MLCLQMCYVGVCGIIVMTSATYQKSRRKYYLIAAPHKGLVDIALVIY
jgi:hypothetical protein